MAEDEAIFTLERVKVATARALVGATSTSEVIDVALDRLIRAERRRSDVDAYLAHPQTPAETAVGRVGDHGGLDDDIDGEALYPEEAS